MKITSKSGNGNKVHIYIDGKYTLTLYDDFWYRLGYEENREISETELASLKEEAGFRLAYEKGLDYLTRRAYSEKELFLKLKQKFDENSAERAVEKLSYYGYLNDEEFSRQYTNYLFESKKYDIKRISLELKTKGISREIIDNTLKTLDNEPIPRIIVMLTKKFPNGFKDEKEQKRFFNKLVRMGYSFSDIKAAFCEFGEIIEEVT